VLVSFVYIFFLNFFKFFFVNRVSRLVTFKFLLKTNCWMHPSLTRVVVLVVIISYISNLFIHFYSRVRRLYTLYIAVYTRIYASYYNMRGIFIFHFTETEINKYVYVEPVALWYPTRLFIFVDRTSVAYTYLIQSYYTWIHRYIF